MHAVMRSYSGKGAKDLFTALDKHKADVEKALRAVKGFASYTLARTGDGGFSVTVCKDKAGCDESLKVAREWIAKNAANTGAASPVVTEGTVLINAHAH
ncbi:MAG: hypothetical protein HY245_14945 [Rhizobiales bacterium]|nr:hypothetical protein [Hyphomicrobiales bacterium]MBI3674687.1 hypothetical protein [Hyphomicrobiales bacterium]